MTKIQEGSQPIKVLLIGCGLHAKRVYLPFFGKIAREEAVQLAGVVDLESKRSKILGVLRSHGLTPRTLFVDEFPADLSRAPTSVSNKLGTMVKSEGIQGVIISTNPDTHKAYANWAMSEGLHILMEKPITTRNQSTCRIASTKGIIEDYEELLKNYQALQKQKDTAFSILTQRRFERGYEMAKKYIEEVRDLFNIPVTSIQAMHSDGVWIFPDEILTQNYHPYFSGTGKCSHSGYHVFDAVWFLYQAGRVEDKAADEIEFFSSFIQPSGLLTQFNQNDYLQCFGEEYRARIKKSDNKLIEEFKDFGENDAFCLLRLLRDGENVCNISINLLHNSISRRSWSDAAEDLYKGNGRIKHQSYIIQQGPFQAIQIHNFQSNDKHDLQEYDINDTEVGGNNHFDIHIFRNSALFGKDEKPFRKISIKDIHQEEKLSPTGLHNENAKEEMILEFLQCIRGNIKVSDLRSNIDSHEMSVKIMSGIYQAHVTQSKRNHCNRTTIPINK